MIDGGGIYIYSRARAKGHEGVGLERGREERKKKPDQLPQGRG